ncbi:hypothetical protein PFISCL1PPCAC_5725 [Pristionchus fissidentatus]|uniref:Uncharacterized protein n=1 Tax=Pristionchus fissidentatus TaxID=1538716 RepID=A0AAV5V872_9BILA|nr:hypothetical protein PFISCL1PPCAC_5725 [Pristionchus fissidentatus]
MPRSIEMTPERMVTSHSQMLGVVVDESPSYGLIYSSSCGLCLLPHSPYTPSLDRGTVVLFRVFPLTHPLNSNVPSIHWTAVQVSSRGKMFEKIPYFRHLKLQLQVDAIVNRVDKKARSAWLWNDTIGRIHVAPLYFNPSLRPFDVVRLVARFDAHFEDVPWSGKCLMNQSDSDKKRAEVGRMLWTSDGWTVVHTQMAHNRQSIRPFYAILSHSLHGVVFCAWTDMNGSDIIPEKNAVFRATIHSQIRPDKCSQRAVLVTQLNEKGQPIHYHPFFNVESRDDTGPSTSPCSFQRVSNYNRSMSIGSGSTASSVYEGYSKSEMELMKDMNEYMEEDETSRERRNSSSSLGSVTLPSVGMYAFCDPLFKKWRPKEE